MQFMRSTGAIGTFEGAEAAYLHAIRADPHNEHVVRNFNTFLKRCRGEDPFTGIDAFEKMRLYQVNHIKFPIEIWRRSCCIPQTAGDGIRHMTV